MSAPGQICDCYHESSSMLFVVALENQCHSFFLCFCPTRGKINRKLVGGIILGFLTAAAAAAFEAMEWDHHLRPPTPSSSNAFTQSHKENVLDEEDRVLCLLLEAFPGVSHETLAIAYARAERDPNKAAEILSAAEAQTGRNGERSAQSSDSSEEWEPPNQNPETLSLEEELRSFSGNGPTAFHSDDFSSKETDSHQLKNGHGDFAGASVWRDPPILSNHARPPELGIESLVPSDHLVKPNSPEGNGHRVVICPPLQRTNTSRTSSSSKPNRSTRSSTLKLSAATGSVSNRMQRRPSASYANGNGYSEMVIDRGGEVGDGLYSEKALKKRSKTEDGKAEEEERRRAAEDFLHSMLGGDFGIDLVRDVLDHYDGDSEKALDTLLNIGSTSSGFDYNKGAVDAVDPFFASLSLSDQNGDNGDAVHPPGSLLEVTGDPEADLLTDDEDLESQTHRILLVMLCHDFPTLEQSSLAQVLQAAEFSYEGALEILKESGMTAVGEQTPKPKLDPHEVLQSLFRTGSETPAVTGHLGEPSVPPPLVATDEPWSAVVAKPRAARNPETQAQKLSADGTAELDAFNKYYRQRASANELWETMKTYMKGANAAYNRGDRERAGLLSERGAKFKLLARAASERASQNIFNVRNKNLPNNITIDLHSQHVAEALSLLQLHLRTLSQIPSVNGLTVITGQGSHSAGGQAKIKPAVTRYLDKKQVIWTQENPGCIIIKMSDVRRSDLTPRDAESYSDSE